MENNRIIDSKGLMIFTISTQIGIGIITIPSLLAEESGHDGWISVLLTGIICTLLSALIILFLRRYGNKSIFDINKFLYGKLIGMFFNVLMLIFLLYCSSVSVRIFSAYLRLTLLPETPAIVLNIFTLLPSMYIIWQGLRPLCRFSNIILFIIISTVLYLLIPYKHYRASFLLPIGDMGIKPILYSIKTSLFAYAGLELVVFIYPNISDKKNVLKYHVLANIISLVFFTIIMICVTCLFGANMLKILTIPVFNMSRIIKVPILERTDLYFIAFWFLAVASSLRTYLYTAYYGILHVFKLKKNKVLYILYFAVIILLSRIPQNMNQVFLSLEIFNTISIAFVLFLVASFVFSCINKKGACPNEEK